MRLTDRELAAVLFGLRNLPRADSDTLTTQEIDDLCERLTGEDISAGAGRRGRSDALIEFLRRGHDRLPPTIASSADACTGSIYDPAGNVIGTVTITTK